MLFIPGRIYNIHLICGRACVIEPHKKTRVAHFLSRMKNRRVVILVSWGIEVCRGVTRPSTYLSFFSPPTEVTEGRCNAMWHEW
jgi:hypothetical protein